MSAALLAALLVVGAPATAATTAGPATRARTPGPATEGPTSAGVGVEAIAHQAAAGTSSDGRWLLGASAGYPWWSARAQLGLGHGISTAVELQTALARRWRPAVGLSMLWLDRRAVRISGEALVGWLVQTGELARRGPNAELRLRLALRLRRAAPYLMVGSQHTLLADRTTTITAAGDDVRWSARGEWTGWATLGVIAAVNRRVGIDLGVDLTWVDAPGTVAIPGAHVGLVFGGFWR